ncbi:MAG TPA: protein kinase [Candidatus Polarisedimenticolaceae bacterium]|nr:protein kinase [Candidatus Polarisedimenticolaceae bacterium]
MARIAHYEIEERLGQGGMGEVFRARDLALGRTVAIKVLPESFSDDLKSRLLQEAEAARRLQHPGIATFFEAGEEHGRAFIAMEHVNGRTLRARLREGALPLPEALAIASGLLEALGHAHHAGIVHRDIKPENVMLAEGGVAKLLDFGLAVTSVLDDATRTKLTATGAIVGTPGYMAPEQLNGEAVDARTDLFAVGAVLYEMIAGRPAFAGGTMAAQIAATLFADPEPLSGSLWGVVARALAKHPAERYAAASELLRDLRRLDEGHAVAAYPDSLAVLDFENRSADPKDAWIGAGIAETLTADLSRFAGLRMIPRPRVAAAAARVRTPSSLGAHLGCRWVLSGTVQRAGDKLRVLMQLTHVPTEALVLNEKLDGSVDELFTIQDRLAERAGEALALRDSQAAAAASPVPALNAYECYTRGQQHWIRMAKGEFDRAQELFEEAVKLDPTYADALTGLAAVHDMRFTFTTDRAELSRAEELARAAIASAPDHGGAHVWLGYARWRLGDGDEALRLMERAGVLAPASHYPPYFTGAIRVSQERHAEALPCFQHAVQLAPIFGFAWVGLGCAHMELEAFDEARWSLDRAIAMETQGLHSTAGAAGLLGECLRRAGKLDAARAACLAGLDSVERSDHMYRDTFRAICLNALGRTLRDAGDREGARAAFHQSTLHLGGRPRTLGGGWLLADALSGLGRREDAPGDRSWFWGKGV